MIPNAICGYVPVMYVPLLTPGYGGGLLVGVGFVGYVIKSWKVGNIYSAIEEKLKQREDDLEQERRFKEEQLKQAHSTKVSEELHDILQQKEAVAHMRNDIKIALKIK